jgi:hypothetical protein
MATIQVTAPNGRTIRIQAPDGATEEEIRRYVGEIARTQPDLGLPIPGMPEREPAPVDDGGPGLLGAAGNAVVRMGGRAVGLTDAYRAEQLSRAADAQEEMSRREAAGEMSLLDRIATWRPSWAAPLETPEELRGLAGDRIAAQAQRDQTLAEQFPMSERGSRGVRALSEAESFSEGLGVIANQPLDVLAGALEVGVEQAPTLAAAAAATVATRNPGVGMGIMGASTYAQERFGQMSAVAQEFGYDLTDPAQARAAVRDEEFMRAQEERGMTRGAVIAAVDALTFRAGAALFGPNLRGLAGNAALQVGGGAGGEALAQYASGGEISAPGEVLLEGLAEGPFSAVELAMGRTGRGEPTPTGTELDATLAAEEAALAADARRQQEEQAAAQDVEVRTTRLDYAPTFVSEKDFVTQQQEAVRRDAVDPNTETGQAYRQYLLDNDILPTNPQEETSAVNAFVKQTVGAQDAGTVAQQYRAALDEHIGRMRDLETLLTADPNAEQQLELDLADPNSEAAPTEAAPAVENQDGQMEMDLATAEEATPQAPDPARLATELVKATGVAVDERVAAEISARMQQIIELPVVDRLAAARALVANYTTPQKKAAAKKTEAAAQKPAEPTVARVPPEITIETPVRRRQEGQAKADALLPANWTEDARYDNVNSALNGKNFNIKKFNTALEAALKPQEETQADATPEAAADAKPNTAAGDARRALIAEANKRLGTDWATTHPDIMEMIGRDRLKSAADRIAEVAPVEEATADAEANLPAETGNAATDVVEAAALPTVVENANLSGNEQKVFKVLMEAFQNNEQDAVMQADGSWNTAEIGKRAGVGAKTANTYISRSVNKIAKSLGVTPDQMRERLRQTGKERRQGEAAPAFDAPTVVLDAAELGDSVGTKASANQGARDGMSKEDQAYLDEKIAKEPDQYENKRQQLADRERRNDTARMVKQYGQMAIQMWQNISSGGAVRLQDLSAPDLREWLGSVEEHAVGEITYDELVADQREMERRYDANQGGVTMEELDGQQTTTEDRGAQGDAEVDGVQSAGPAASQGGGDQTQQVRGEDTGAPRGERQQVRDVAQQISDADPTPKELRNQRSFKESYAAKEGASSGLWENPNLKEAAQLADWLGSLTQDQWDAINPSFTNDLNPFKNPASIDFQQAKAKLEAAMNQSAPDTGVVGEAKAAPKVEVRKKRKVVNRPKFSIGEVEAMAEGPVATNVKNAVKWLIGKEANWRISTVRSPEDLIGLVLSGELNIEGLQLDDILSAKNPYGVVVQNRDGVTQAFFFTDNIRPGAERAVVMHEVGSHIGMDNVLTGEQKSTVVKKIKDWATSEGRSLEKSIAERAIARVDNAIENDGIAGETADEIAANMQSEYIAYFLEEAVKAGVNPNSDSKSELVQFIRQLWADFKRALRKLRPENEPALTAQDLVNMARGAARLELATNYHGTTAKFRRFNSDFMGTGEGNAAFGSGTYFAEHQGTGDFYMRQDMRDKGSQLGRLMRVDIAVTPEESLDWYARVNDQPQIMEAFNNFPEEIRDGILEDFNTETVAPLTGRQLYIGLAQLQLRDYALEGYIDDAAYDRANRATRQVTSAMMMASSFLDSRGIKAIKYKDKASRDGKATPDTDNYVVFNDDNIVKVGENTDQDVLGETTAAGTVRFSTGPQNASRTEQFLTKALGGPRSAQIVADTKAIFKKPLDATKFLHQFIEENRKDMPSAGKWYDAMLEQEQTVNEILARGEPIVLAYRELKADRQALVNDFIGASTFYQKWGYDPQWQNKQVKIDPVMKTKFNRLTAEEQQIVRDIFQHGEDMRIEMQDLAKQLGVPPRMFSMNSKLDGPYAPLKRFGNNVAVLRSQQLADMEAQLRQNPQDKKLADAIEKMKGDGAHYVVSFFDTIGAAEKFAFENKQNYPVTEVSEKAPDTFGDRITNPEAFAKVISAVKADSKSGLDDTTRQAVTKIVEQLYYESLGEQNARLSGARRLNRAGYEKDMVRSFMSHLQAQARLVAQLKHGADINTAFAEAQREAGSDRRRLQPVFNMIARKYNHVLSNNRSLLTSVQDNIAAFNTVYMLTSNIGYHVANATQPMISVAKMAGDFGKYPGAWGALIRGYKNSRNVVKSSMFKQAASALTVGFVDMNNKVEIDISKAPPKYRKLLETLQLRQLLDVGMEEDLNLENRFDTGYEIVNKASEGFSNMTHRLYQVARYVEAHNRVASAIAAYDMATSNPQMTSRMKMTPEEYAISVVQDTQGNFSSFDAPLLIDALPKLTTQFRKFQLMMAWLYGSAFKKAFNYKALGGSGNKYERAAGRRTLGYLMAHAAALSGASGVPLVSTIAPFVMGMFGDEDEPEDLERYIREELFPDNDRMADLVARGVPAFFGIDMSTKLTQGDIFTPVNLEYIDSEPSAQGARNIVVQSVFGPTAGVISNMGRAAQFLSEGDIIRGTEYLVPRGVRSILETYRYANEGYTLNKGDVVLDPRDIDVSSLLLNAIGLPPEEVSQLRWTYGQQYELRQWFSGESSRIRSDYVEAYQARDRETMSELRREWRDLQEAKDRVRPFFNNSRSELRRQSVTDLLSAPREQRRRETKYREALGTE